MNTRRATTGYPGWHVVGASIRGRLAAALVLGIAVLSTLFTALAIAPGPAAALEIEFSGRPVKRDILALYDSRRERQPHETRIHKFAEMPLNYLGLRVVYFDVNRPLPDAGTLSRYRGVLTWFVEPLRQPERVLDWLDQATTKGLKHVVLGEVAPPGGEWLSSQTNRLLARIGLESTGDYVELTYRAKIAGQAADVVGFERPVDRVLPGFPIMRPKGGATTAHLLLETPLGGNRVQSAVIATGPGGGYAAHNYTIHYEPNIDRVRWTLNPFAFFKRALGEERFPIPDATTVSGRRIYFSHIDGDGWNNLTEIEGYRDGQRTAAEVIAREAIIPYPDLPVTVGIIAGDVDRELGGNPAGRLIARQLFALPQVEVGSHTYTHPYAWQFFEAYDRDEELRKVEQYTPPDLTMRERFSRGVVKLAKKELPADRYDPFVAGTDDLPRTFLRKPFDLDIEVKGALQVSESLAPPGKPARAYLWSGDTTPFPGAIKAVRMAGARNINGGDSRLDGEFPSVTYVPPLSRPAGQERQIYAGNSNENTYTNDWTGPFYGFFLLEKTLANTERPRRLKPFNLYYHMYSGEKTSSLAAVRHFLDMARKGPVTPITASHYAAIADDFFATEIEQVDLFSWAVSARGAMQTVRFDDAEQLSVDLARSTGVLGSTRHEGALLVALDKAAERAVVTLRARQMATPAEPAIAEPASLVESRWIVSNLVRETCNFSMDASGFGPGEMLWMVPRRQGYKVSALRGGALLSQETRWPDADGNFRIRFEQSAIEPLTIRFDCHE
ncbi:MAG: polysaccharide deacetylase family protein [Hyphomicrobiaceae bacterium]